MRRSIPVMLYAAGIGLLLHCGAVAAQSAADEASQPDGTRTLKILGIGNSFLRNVVNHLPGLVQAGGHNFVLGAGTPGGRALQNHYEAAMLGDANPEDPKDRI